MPLKEDILRDLNSAVKEKRELEVLVLRQLSSAFLNKEKEKRFKSGEKKDVQLEGEEALEVVSAEVKKRREAIIEYEKGKREDLSEKEKKELEILEKYLPEQLSEEEVKRLVKEAVDRVGAKDMKDMGKVMQELMPKVKGKADGVLVSKIVKELLSKNES
ncbi:MAG: GatB/YqeY domain-containing protein [bacterium]